MIDKKFPNISKCKIANDYVFINVKDIIGKKPTDIITFDSTIGQTVQAMPNDPPKNTETITYYASKPASASASSLPSEISASSSPSEISASSSPSESASSLSSPSASSLSSPSAPITSATSASSLSSLGQGGKPYPSKVEKKSKRRRPSYKKSKRRRPASKKTRRRRRHRR